MVSKGAMRKKLIFLLLYQNNILLICGRTESFCGRTHRLSVGLTSFEIPKNGSQEKMIWSHYMVHYFQEFEFSGSLLDSHDGKTKLLSQKLMKP